MTAPEDLLDELPAVAALRSLSIFSADQAGAYREHFQSLSDALGEDVPTRLASHVTAWAGRGEPGAIVLTGNAGTGKTAVAESYCQRVGGELPASDEPCEVAPGRWVVKDLSGLSDDEARRSALQAVLDGVAAGSGQYLVCANEGVLRDALDVLDHSDFAGALEEALRSGAAQVGGLVVVNVNRQRPTALGLWDALLDFLTREELWTGCTGCPFKLGGCPMRSNAEALRNPDVRRQLRTLVRLGAGEAVPTIREVLSVLSWAVVGEHGCRKVKAATRDLDRSAFTATSGYFTRVVGGGLQPDAIERSPLMAGMRTALLGHVSDLEIDGWLRDTTGAPDEVRLLAGDPAVAEDGADGSLALAGSQSPLDRVRTKQGTMTFQHLGEIVSTSEDPTKVDDGLDALVAGDGDSNAPAQVLWRQRLYFEASAALGGPDVASRRLLGYRYVADLVELAEKAAGGEDVVIEVAGLVRGLNFLVTGFSSPTEGLVVPDPACLFARDPGSFRPARPSLVYGLVPLDRLAVRVPDRGLVEQLLDVDHVDVELAVDGRAELSLRIRPRMYEAIREAADFQGPVGQGVAEMNDLRGFYSRLASAEAAGDGIRVADPDSNPPALVKVNLPHFATSRRV
ncbi:ATP-binding protein [Verrucosispora sp. WMMD573]|uniref:ATP-binding protein n=1 Tax=Verrucosispora sp. WMMD573 TaxID=3015149 RepID=UPI00248BBCE2|nr:ATP-binding protein [Verrucosispora sp. WMMD573]WBB56300.1 ATP-binding protein [Verrucosispora sp. WMMD573]